MIEFRRWPSETEESYLWRLGQAKDNGLLDIEWSGIADMMNREFRADESEYRTEAAYRKPYQQAKKFYESGVFNALGEDEYIDELRTQRQELEKEKVKTRDERNELRRMLREEARKESYIEQVIRCIKEYQSAPIQLFTKDLEGRVISADSDNDLIISCTDIHAGIEIDNYFNKFNQDVLLDRFEQYVAHIVKIAERHDSRDAHIIISEVISGLIHPTIRIENNQDVIQQFLMVTDYLSQMLSRLSPYFENIHVYVCPGNHSRLHERKEESLKGENMDHLVIPFLEAKLQNFTNIHFHLNTIEESIAMFNVRGNVVMASHGDKDSPENVVQKLTMMFSVKPQLCYLGHRHKNAMTTVYNTKVIESGCMSGTDSYAIDHRLSGKPSQTVSVVNSAGLVCLYDINFD